MGIFLSSFWVSANPDMSECSNTFELSVKTGFRNLRSTCSNPIPRTMPCIRSRIHTAKGPIPNDSRPPASPSKTSFKPSPISPYAIRSFPHKSITPSMSPTAPSLPARSSKLLQKRDSTLFSSDAGSGARTAADMAPRRGISFPEENAVCRLSGGSSSSAATSATHPFLPGGAIRGRLPDKA